MLQDFTQIEMHAFGAHTLLHLHFVCFVRVYFQLFPLLRKPNEFYGG